MPAVNRSSLASALVLIGIGAWFLAIQLSEPVKALAYGAHTWPYQIIGVGAVLLLIGLVTWTPGLFIPASIVGGVGALLYYQNATGRWETWAYAWMLIPGFVGLGLVLSGAAQRQRGALLTGAWMLLISLIVFGIFAAFLGGPAVANFWPLLLIGLGIVLLGQAFLRRK